MAGGEDLSSREVISFGPFRLFPAERFLEKAGSLINLRGFALDILITLVSRPGKLVTKKELLDQVWTGTTVGEATLRFHVSALRRALSDGQGGARYVTNVPGRGYCFVAPLSRTATSNGTTAVDGIAGLPHNLPTRTGRIIGRDAAIQTTAAQLLAQRVVTVVGPGGIGKTTVAIAVADMLLANFRNAVFFVDLAPLADPLLVPSALASVLGLIVQSENPLPTLIKFLRNKRALIVLDNCDRMIEAVAELVDRILKDAPSVHTLVTSREPLRINGERVHRLAALESPPAKSEIKATEANAFPAVQLFVERAAESFDGFVFDDTAAPSVAELCRRLDGIPLAIELAAARVDFGVRGLAAGLNDMFALLTKGRRTAMPRHQTLRATLDWGYQLLSPSEQTILRRVSAFRASFTLDSAATLAIDHEVTRQDVMDGVANLALKSFLTAEATHEIVQYRLLETTRAYAGEKLAESGEDSAYAQRHAKYYLELMKVAESDWETKQQDRWMGLYAGRIDDIRAALDWSFSPEGDVAIGVALTAASAPLWFALSLVDEFCDRARSALLHVTAASLAGSDLEMKLNMWQIAAISISRGHGPDMAAASARTLEIASKRGATAYQLGAIRDLARDRFLQGDYAGALAFSEQFWRVAGAWGDEGALFTRNRLMGMALHLVGRHAEALTHLERARTPRAPYVRAAHNFFHEYDDDGGMSGRVARILWHQGFPVQAAKVAEEAIQQAIALGHPRAVWYTAAFSACPIAFWNGDVASTTRYIRLFTEKLEELSSGYWEAWRRCYQLASSLGDNDGTPEFQRRVEAILKTANGPLLLDTLGTIREELAGSYAVARAERGESGWCAAEILRAKGAHLLRRSGQAVASEAEAQFQQALDLARHQKALSWELRSATSLARLLRQESRRDHARAVLAPVYGRFSEGFECADLVEAKSLLDDLDQSWGRGG
jgi:predicted ATPase/DNA-binding winged helix-turn-helix (wHTH) protein